MARTNIEEEAHRRVYKLSQLLRITDREALGTVGYLWTESQDILKIEGTLSEILEWSHLYDLSDEEIKKWISALEKSRLISLQENGNYRIHGNETQIETRVSYMKRAAKGGKALQKKWSDEKRLKAGLKKASRKQQASLKQAPSPSIQGITIQGITEQDNANQDKAILKEAVPKNSGPAIEVVENSFKAKPIDTSHVIALYCESWKSKYGSNPPITGKDTGLFKTLVKDLGLTKACSYVEAYLQMPDQWFLTKRHDVASLVNNLAKVEHFISSGRTITQKEIRGLEDRVMMQNTLDAINSGKI